MRARRPWHHRVQRKVHRLLDQHWPAVLIKFTRSPVLCGKRRGRDQLAICGIQHVEEAVLGRLHHDTPVGSILTQRQISKRNLLRGGVVPAIPRRRLVVPAVFAGIGIDRENRRQEQIVTIAIWIANIRVPG